MSSTGYKIPPNYFFAWSHDCTKLLQCAIFRMCYNFNISFTIILKTDLFLVFSI